MNLSLTLVTCEENWGYLKQGQAETITIITFFLIIAQSFSYNVVVHHDELSYINCKTVENK